MAQDAAAKRAGSAVQAALPLLEAAVTERVTPGAALAVVAGGATATAVTGAVAYGGAPVTEHTRYDLASVTKVTACLPSVLALLQAGEVALTDPVSRFFSNAGWMQEPSLGQVTLEDLLLHRSGLPAWRPLFAWVTGRQLVIANVLQSPRSEPAGAYLYSDLGVMTLTAIIERVSGQRIDEFATEHVMTPLGMHDTMFGPLPPGTPVALTEEDGLRGLLEGRVHDENADAMAGVSGHAGLFGTAADLARYAAAWLKLEAPFANAELMRSALLDRSQGAGVRRGLLWRLRQPDWPFGEGPSERAFGHTGFTGTSLLVDPEQGAAVVLLTNRVHPNRGTPAGVAALRLAVHDAVTEALS